MLERNVKQSRFLDVESLCIRAAEKVWQIRVDLNALNHDGNILDCANLALVCAVAHYRIPEVSVTGDEIKIVSLKSFTLIRKIQLTIVIIVYVRRKKSSAFNHTSHSSDNYIRLFRPRVKLFRHL